MGYRPAGATSAQHQRTRPFLADELQQRLPESDDIGVVPRGAALPDGDGVHGAHGGGQRVHRIEQGHHGALVGDGDVEPREVRVVTQQVSELLHKLQFEQAVVVVVQALPVEALLEQLPAQGVAQAFTDEPEDPHARSAPSRSRPSNRAAPTTASTMAPSRCGSLSTTPSCASSSVMVE